MDQTIRYLKTADGVRLAWAQAGSGTPLVKVANWLSHLEFDLESPVWRHWVEFLGTHYRSVRYDERGCGLSEWEVGDVSYPRWVEDLEAVVEASRPPEPFFLFGVSQGGAPAITYSIRHPERVAGLVLYGCYARGVAKRGDTEAHQRFKALVDLTRLGWGQDNPVFRNLFTARFVPEATEEQRDWFNELCRRTTTPEIASELLLARATVDIESQLPKVTVPTLVLHSRRDEVVPLSEGQLLASEIPGARFVLLESKNHILLEDEPAWSTFRRAVLEFTAVDAPPPASPAVEDTIFSTLTAREREVLERLVAGLTNAQIGRALFISEKTVRNHVTHVFEKLGVDSRARAIVLAKDRGFGESEAG